MTMTKLMGDLVAVEAPEEQEIRTAFGLILPSDQKSLKCITAKVIAVGPGKFLDKTKKKRFRPTTVKVGDTIVFGKAIAKMVKVDEKRYLVLHEDDIFGIVE